MMKWTAMAVGGVMGTLLRYALSQGIYATMGTRFPWGTLGVNLIGCFTIGLLVALFENARVSPAMRDFLLIGLLGAFTTFSTFALDALNLIRDRQYLTAGSYLLTSVAAGVLLAIAGLLAGRGLVAILR